jgi:CBS-domain-containing membrane protein
MRVRDLMTPKPATVRSTASIVEAIEILEALDVRHIPVVDDHGSLVGMLSDRDVRAMVGPYPSICEERRAELRCPVARVMNTEARGVAMNDTAQQAIEALLAQRVGALPVLDEDEVLVGIVSYVDILRALGDVLDRNERRPMIRGDPS